MINQKLEKLTLSDFDSFIVAIAFSYNLLLATRNVRYFKRVEELNLV